MVEMLENDGNLQWELVMANECNENSIKDQEKESSLIHSPHTIPT